MHSLLVALLALQSATIVAVLNQGSDTLLAVRIGDVIVTAEFSHRRRAPKGGRRVEAAYAKPFSHDYSRAQEPNSRNNLCSHLEGSGVQGHEMGDAHKHCCPRGH
jgi:hypothetical protein